MSTASKVVLGVSVVLTLSTVAAVHIKQTWDRQRLHEGVIRDLERVERKKENLRLLEEQRTLTRQLEEDRRRRETELRPQDH
ncbi:protein PET117 homolog, mitochondrial [Acanthopagrus latus]|uniref:protein PET117 homolog, mitochondrial n=1 Tax=Acanthopagrus latus TaxID=8177 RepID=UPI00187BD887|nr:protein PET117 homolog, mitochondrial [Acanthopagrus latus]